MYDGNEPKIVFTIKGKFKYTIDARFVLGKFRQAKFLAGMSDKIEKTDLKLLTQFINEFQKILDIMNDIELTLANSYLYDFLGLFLQKNYGVNPFEPDLSNICLDLSRWRPKTLPSKN